IRVRDMTTKKTWTERIVCSSAVANGWWARTRFQRVRMETTSSAELAPRGPNRIAAHNRNGQGAYTHKPSANPGFSPNELNTARHTDTRPIPSDPASMNRARD